SYIKEEGLNRYTPKTICTPEDFRSEIAKVRSRGYAFDDEENETGIFCVGAPILDSYGETVAAISVSTPVFRLDKNNIDSLISEVCSCSNRISSILGYINEEKKDE
ncbi:MAG: IclR family transcriptional regulator C-terminal domain-containing protein, partial [Spirochaetales bacterium]|nr:IclR family transcriptional regulator C-terminal domain-containing protein [Spirochaetales bacterium]